MGHEGCDPSQASGPWAIGSEYRFTACRGMHLYVGPEHRPSRPRGAACLRPVDVDEGEASPVRADLQGRGLPGEGFL